MSRTSGAVLRALHRPGDPFVLANAWDAGTAQMLAARGAVAIGTSSAAHAFTLGRPDGQVSRDEALTHAELLVAATPLPVSGDFESGYGETADDVAETVRLAAEVGLAGISVEDTAPTRDGSYPFEVAVERIAAAVDAARSLPDDFVLLARADGLLYRSYDLSEGISRLQAFEAAGADALYLPGPPDLEALSEICRAVGRPVNALAAGPFTRVTRAEYARVGAARISLGSSLARMVQRAIDDAAKAMFDDGDFTALGHVLPGPEVDDLLDAGQRATPGRRG